MESISLLFSNFIFNYKANREFKKIEQIITCNFYTSTTRLTVGETVSNTLDVDCNRRLINLPSGVKEDIPGEDDNGSPRTEPGEDAESAIRAPGHEEAIIIGL